MAEISPLVKEKEKKVKESQKEYNDYVDLERATEKLLEKACLEEPKSGDFWHEMFSPIFVIIVVHDNKDLTVCKHTIDAGDNKYSFDVAKSFRITNEDFRKESDGCSVVPERCKGIFEEWQEHIANKIAE